LRSIPSRQARVASMSSGVKNHLGIPRIRRVHLSGGGQSKRKFG
jgi:hypothetical protein